MAIYTIESDKTFLRSTGGGEVSVYEIESLDIALLQEMHWSSPSTIHFGKRLEFQVLKVGNIEIKGRDLTTFLEDLRDSRLMVNREGLCILPTSNIASKEFEVEYYRMFDLFDWSKYRVKSTLTTKWSRSDVLTGRSILISQSSDHEHEKLLQQRLMALEKELEDQKNKCESELKELAESLQQNENKLHLKQQQVIGLEEELKLQAFAASVIMRVRIPCRSIDVARMTDMSRCGFSARDIFKATIIDTYLNKEAVESRMFQPEALLGVEYDTENWWAIKIVLGDNIRIGTFIYYDGNLGYYSFDDSADRMPIPIRNGPTSKLWSYAMYVCNVQRLGVRYGRFTPD